MLDGEPKLSIYQDSIHRRWLTSAAKFCYIYIGGQGFWRYSGFRHDKNIGIDACARRGKAGI